jgi:hypothetical protein
LIGNIKIIVPLTLEFLYKSHLVVLSGNIKKCSFQSAIGRVFLNDLINFAVLKYWVSVQVQLL